MSPCVTDETGQPDQGQSNDIGMPVESQTERVQYKTVAQPRTLPMLWFASMCPNKVSVAALSFGYEI